MTDAPCPLCRAPHRRLGRTRPLAALRAAPAKLAAALRRTPPRLRARRPAPAEWAVNEVLSHLADAEVVLGARIRSIAGEPGSPLVAWDQERWAEGGHYRRQRATEALRAFAEARRANLAYVARLRPAQRRQSGMHPEYGELTIEHLLAHFAEHDLNHLEQIEAARAGRA